MLLLRTIRESVLAKQVSALWAAEGVALVMALVQAVVIARMLGPTEFGRASLILSSTSLTFSLLDPKAQDAVVKYLGSYHATGQVDRALAVPKVMYTATLLVGLAGFAIVAGGAPWIEHHIIHTTGISHLLVVFAFAAAFAAPLATSRAVLSTFHHFSKVAAMQASFATLRTALMIGLVGMGLGVHGVVYGAGVAMILESLVAAVVAHRVIVDTLGAHWWAGRRAVLGHEFRELLRFMLYTDLTSLFAAVTREADLVVLGFVRGPTEAGYYRLARSAAQPMSSIVMPLQQVVYPRLTAMAAVGDREGIRRAVRRYTVHLGAPIAVVALLTVPTMPLVIPALAGSGYRPTVAAAMVLLAGTALAMPMFWAEPMLLATGHVGALLLVSATTSTLTLASYFVLGNLLGDVGVAGSRVGIAGLLGSIVLVIYFFRQHNHAATSKLPAL